MAAQQTSPASAPHAIPPALFNACFALLVINACYLPAAYVSGMWIREASGLGIPTDFVNVWAAVGWCSMAIQKRERDGHRP